MAIIQHLLVDEYGSFIGKYSQRLKVTCKKETLVQAPLMHLESVIVSGKGISISADVIAECAERGIPIFFMKNQGAAYASIYSSGLTGTVLTRRAQLEAIRTSQGLFIALAFAQGKIHNQSNLIKYMAKYRKEKDPELFIILRTIADDVFGHALELEGMKRYPEVRDESANVDDLRAEIMGFEGSAARCYWGAMKRILPEVLQWPGRKGRGAVDEVNSALNYGYGILYSQVERALVLAGLDPYAGFLHVDRPGKPSLTLDFIEEFRQIVVDRTVVGIFNKGTRLRQDDHGLLEKESRRLLADKILKRLESSEYYEGKRHAMRAIIQMQARHLATYLRKERDEYKPFLAQW